MRTERKNLILLEMIVVLFFFSLSATITLQLFVSAYEKSVASESETKAYLLAEDVLARISHDPFSAEKVLAAGDGWRRQETTGGVEYLCTFDKHFAAADEEHAVYRMAVSLYDQARSDAGVLTGIRIEVYRQSGDAGASEVCLSLTGANYVPGQREVFA